MKHPLISDTDRSGLVRINTRNNKNLILYFILHFPQSGNIINHGVLMISGTRSDHQKQPVILSLKNTTDLRISLCLCGRNLITHGKLLLELLRRRQLPQKFHIHFHKQTSSFQFSKKC